MVWIKKSTLKMQLTIFVACNWKSRAAFIAHGLDLKPFVFFFCFAIMVHFGHTFSHTLIFIFLQRFSHGMQEVRSSTLLCTTSL